MGVATKERILAAAQEIMLTKGFHAVGLNEMANLSEPMREVLAQGMKSWRLFYVRALHEGREDGSIRQELNPAEVSALIQDMWQGAMQRVLVERSVAPLRSASKFLYAYLKTG